MMTRSKRNATVLSADDDEVYDDAVEELGDEKLEDIDMELFQDAFEQLEELEKSSDGDTSNNKAFQAAINEYNESKKQPSTPGKSFRICLILLLACITCSHSSSLLSFREGHRETSSRVGHAELLSFQCSPNIRSN